MRSCLPCPPGQTIPLLTGLVGTAFFGGTATLDGASYIGIGNLCGGSSCVSLRVDITGESVIAPPLNVASLVTLTNPVQLTGFFVHPVGFPPVSAIEALEGAGLGTVDLTRSDACGCWSVTTATYDFQPTPVPEPATLTLAVLTGLGMTLASRRQQRPQGRPAEPVGPDGPW